SPVRHLNANRCGDRNGGNLCLKVEHPYQQPAAIFLKEESHLDRGISIGFEPVGRRQNSLEQELEDPRIDRIGARLDRSSDPRGLAFAIGADYNSRILPGLRSGWIAPYL